MEYHHCHSDLSKERILVIKAGVIVSCRQMAFVLLVKNTKPGIIMSVMHVIMHIGW